MRMTDGIFRESCIITKRIHLKTLLWVVSWTMVPALARRYSAEVVTLCVAGYSCAEWIDPIPFSRIPNLVSGYTRRRSIPSSRSHFDPDG